MLCGEFLRQQTPQEELDDILGILRPDEGTGTPAETGAILCGLGATASTIARGFELHRLGGSVASRRPHPCPG